MDMEMENVEETISDTQTELSKFLEWSQTSIPVCKSLDIMANYGLRDNYKRDLSEKECLKFLNHNGESLNIQAILDEKNKEISTLKKQIFNQKLQLKHYLNKNLFCEQVILNGSMVNIAMPEENDIINIAMARFNKINNRKSRMIRVYDKISSTECRLCSLLRKQETILRKVTLDILSSHNESFTESSQEKLNNNYPIQLDLFSRLLTVTVAVKRDSTTLKNYLKRLIAVEEERNALVDHIFRLPAEQRLNGHYLLSVERENARMCLELENIRKEQIALKQKVSQIRHEDEILKETTRELKAKAIMPDFSNKLNDMIHVVEIETETLVIETNEEREKYKQEIEALSLAKQELVEKLSHYIDIESKLSFEVSQLKGKCLEMENRISILLEEKENIEEIKYELAYLQNENSHNISVNNCLKQKVVDLQIVELEHSVLLENVKELESENSMLKQQFNELENAKKQYEMIVQSCPDVPLLLKDPAEYFQTQYSYAVRLTELEEKNQNLQDELSEMRKTIQQEELKKEELLFAFQKYHNWSFSHETDFLNKDKKQLEKHTPPDEYGDRLNIASNGGLSSCNDELPDINLGIETARHTVVNNASLVGKDSEIAVVYHDAEKLLLTPPNTSKADDSRNDNFCRTSASVPQDLGSKINSSLTKSENKLFGDFRKTDDKFNMTKDKSDKESNNEKINDDENENDNGAKEKRDTGKENSKEKRGCCAAIKANLIRGFQKNNSKLPIRNLKQKDSEEEKIIPAQSKQISLNDSLYNHPTLSTVTILNDSEKLESKEQMVKEPISEQSLIPLEIVNGMSINGITDSIVINQDQALNKLPQISTSNTGDTKLEYQSDSNIMKIEKHIKTNDLYSAKGCCPKCEQKNEKKTNENSKSKIFQPKVVEHRQNIEVRVPQVVTNKKQNESTNIVKEIEKIIVGKDKLDFEKFKDSMCMYPGVGLSNLNFD